MDKITPDALMTFFWVGAALIAFTLSIWALVEKIKKALQPALDAAQWRRETDAKLAKDKVRIDSLEDGNKVLLRGILAMLNHEITGNSVDKLKAAQDEITKYLITK
jgi:hypothetical protein